VKRYELEHIIRAAGAIAGSSEIYIIGSQSLLASYPDSPEQILVSQEVDMWPADDPAKADLIDGCIGELSPFHETFGYYAHGVGPETAKLPKNWKNRIVTIQNENTKGIKGLCLNPIDLAICKIIAGRKKDIDFVENLIKFGLVSESEIKSIIAEELDDPLRSNALLGINQLETKK